MQTQLPYWLEILQALATPAIAILGVSIAAAQWYTARSKLVSDLFNRRIEVYFKLRDVIPKIVASGFQYGGDLHADFHKAQDEARFLFGEDVYSGLEEIRIDFGDLGRHNLTKDGRIPEELVAQRPEQLKRVELFPDELAALIAPYARMDHKRPLWWMRSLSTAWRLFFLGCFFVLALVTVLIGWRHDWFAHNSPGLQQIPQSQQDSTIIVAPLMSSAMVAVEA